MYITCLPFILIIQFYYFSLQCCKPAFRLMYEFYQWIFMVNSQSSYYYILYFPHYHYSFLFYSWVGLVKQLSHFFMLSSIYNMEKLPRIKIKTEIVAVEDELKKMPEREENKKEQPRRMLNYDTKRLCTTRFFMWWSYTASYTCMWEQH